MRIGRRLLIFYCTISIVLIYMNANAASLKTILRESQKSPPPAAFISVLEKVRESSFSVKNTNNQKWMARVPCDLKQCESWGPCIGLQRSYLSELVYQNRAHIRIHIWAWEYETSRHAVTVKDEIDAYRCDAGRQKWVLARKDNLVIALIDQCDCSRDALFKIVDPFVKRMRTLLGYTVAETEILDQTESAKKCAQPVKQILDPLTPDQTLAAHSNVFQCPEHRSFLNKRGMTFYAKKDYSRAGWAFEEAGLYPPAVYNRACIAGLQNRDDEAVYWLSRLLELGPPSFLTYCRSSPSDQSIKLIKRSLTDKDFSTIRSSVLYKAFKKCISNY